MATDETAYIEGVLDRYGGVIINEHEVCDCPITFEKKLQASVQKWKEEKRRGIWLPLKITNATHVPIAAKFGFKYHHISHGVLYMTAWLPTEEETQLPDAGFTTIGCGGVCINDFGELLVVKEKHFAHGNNAVWKFPGGYLQPNEELEHAAIREVFEETGIQTESRAILCFRHMSPHLFSGGDFYFVVLLRPSPDSSPNIVIDPREIVESKWLLIEEFLNDPEVGTMNKEIAKIASKFKKGERTGHSEEKTSFLKKCELPNVMQKKIYSFYTIQPFQH